jgi:hypothetical protein
MDWILVLLVLAITTFMILFGGLRAALRLDYAAIVKSGVPASATVLCVGNRPNILSRIWTVTIEFHVPGAALPVQAKVETASIAWLGFPNPASLLHPGQVVPIHYREMAPSMVVVDALPPTLFLRAFRWPA